MTAVDGFVFDLSPSGGSGKTYKNEDANLQDLTLNYHTLGKRYLYQEGFDLFPTGSPTPPVTVYYYLAAIDTGIGRRYWTSFTVDFVSAPSPVGVWDLGSLTVMSSWI